MTATKPHTIARDYPITRVSSTEPIAPGDLVLDDAYQPRCAVDPGLVETYTEAYAAGAPMPPITVAYLDGVPVVLDGWHRTLAAREAGVDALVCEVERNLPRWRALARALGANAEHGARRTRRDVQRAVSIAIADPELGARPAREVARLLAVSQRTIERARAEPTAAAAEPSAPTVPPKTSPKEPPPRTVLDPAEVADRSTAGRLDAMQRIVRCSEALLEEIRRADLLDEHDTVIAVRAVGMVQRLPECLADADTWETLDALVGVLEALEDLRRERPWL